MRHAMGLAGADRADLQAVLMVHGFDIHRDADEVFASALRRAKSQLDGTGLTIMPVWTNLRELGANWEYAHGLAVASCLTLVQTEFSVGFIGSSDPYDYWLSAPWGSSPITDHLYCTGSMDIRHDGAIASRTDKVKAIAEWPNGSRYLRVCWEGADQDANCGRCEKCVRTSLNFLAAGAEVPECFDHRPTPDEIRGLVIRKSVLIDELSSASSFAHARGATGEWVAALDEAISRNQRLLRFKSLRARVVARLPKSVASAARHCKGSLGRRWTLAATLLTNRWPKGRVRDYHVAD